MRARFATGLVLGTINVVACTRQDGVARPLFSVSDRAAASYQSAALTFRTPGFQPSGLAYDGAILYVSDEGGYRTVYKLNPTTGAVLGSFPQGPNPNDIVYDWHGHLFVSDIGSRVYEITTDGIAVNSFALPFRGGAIAFDGTNLYITDFDGYSVLVTDRLGTTVRQFDLPGIRPEGMVFDHHSRHLWVIDEFNSKITELTTEGHVIRQCDGPQSPGIQGIGGLTMVGSTLYIAEVTDPDPFDNVQVPGTIYVVNPRTLPCSPAF